MYAVSLSVSEMNRLVDDQRQLLSVVKGERELRATGSHLHHPRAKTF